MDNDTFRTVEKRSEEVLFKDRGSKFYGYVFPVDSEESIKNYLENLKKEHHTARHWCYAWRLGEENIRYRANDDGEPNNSAGQPIYRQILSKDVTNILLVVVRYFGGTKLGVGGLINAYKTTAKMALETSNIICKTIDVNFELRFEYKDINKVMQIIKENKLQVIQQKMELECEYILSVRKKNEEKIAQLLKNLRCIRIKKYYF